MQDVKEIELVVVPKLGSPNMRSTWTRVELSNNKFTDFHFEVTQQFILRLKVNSVINKSLDITLKEDISPASWNDIFYLLGYEHPLTIVNVYMSHMDDWMREAVAQGRQDAFGDAELAKIIPPIQMADPPARDWTVPKDNR